MCVSWSRSSNPVSYWFVLSMQVILDSFFLPSWFNPYIAWGRKSSGTELGESWNVRHVGSNELTPFSIISELNKEFPAIWLVKRFVLWRFSKFSAPTIAFLAFWLALRHMENSEPSLKIFRTNFSTSALYNGQNKNGRKKPGLRIY